MFGFKSVVFGVLSFGLSLSVKEALASQDELYIGVKQSLSWTNAELYCQVHYGTHLATIESYSDNLMVRDAATTAGIGTDSYIWMGLNDVGNEGIFEWKDGTIVSYTNWDTNQPDNYNDNQNCAYLRSNNAWDDISCSSQLYFVCNAPTEICSMDPSDLGESNYLFEWWNTAGSVTRVYRTWDQFSGNSNWRFLSVVGTIWEKETEGVTVPLYEYYSSSLTSFMYSTEFTTYNNYAYNQIIGYIMKEDCSYNVPFIHYYSSKYYSHWYSNIWFGDSLNDFDNPWDFVDITGYLGMALDQSEWEDIQNQE